MSVDGVTALRFRQIKFVSTARIFPATARRLAIVFLVADEEISRTTGSLSVFAETLIIFFAVNESWQTETFQALFNGIPAIADRCVGIFA